MDLNFRLLRGEQKRNRKKKGMLDVKDISKVQRQAQTKRGRNKIFLPNDDDKHQTHMKKGCVCGAQTYCRFKT